ncbi:MAG: hypothetical protein ACTSWX_12830 [Promethearchaeota archaeon]
MIVIEYKKKPKIVQMELEDYICPKRIKKYRMWIPNDYNQVRKKYD